MRKILICFIFNLLFFQSSMAGTTAALELRATVASVLKSKVTSVLEGDHQTRIHFKSQNNQKNHINTHKVEFSGHEQAGLSTKLKAVSFESGEMDYEIIIKHLNVTQIEYDPIFIKISAN